MMANAPGWQPDPERHDQQRYWDGSGWTDQVRPTDPTDPTGPTGPTGSPGGRQEPGHAPDLHRALAAATADIDAVEARLSTLFDRAPGTDAAPARTTPPVPHHADADEESDDAFDDLNAELAADEPDESGTGSKKARKEKGRRRLFRRSAKGATPAAG